MVLTPSDAINIGHGVPFDPFSFFFTAFSFKTFVTPAFFVNKAPSFYIAIVWTTGFRNLAKLLNLRAGHIASAYVFRFDLLATLCTGIIVFSDCYDNGFFFCALEFVADTVVCSEADIEPALEAAAPGAEGLAEGHNFTCVCFWFRPAVVVRQFSF